MTKTETPPCIVEIFEKHFVSKMKNKDFKQFKRDYPTLYGDVILPALAEMSMKSMDYILQTYRK